LYLRVLPPPLHESPLRFIDVGAGAGIPGIPLLIMRPHWSGVMVDSVGKKVNFMNEALKELGLSGGNAIQGRAEDLGHDLSYRDRFDLGFARAVAALPELLELCLPFVKPQGLLVVSKGAKALDELTSAQKALKVLNGQLGVTAHLELPEGAGCRTLFSVSKNGKTPAHYPRKPGIPHRKPIC
jgi:16S rRNA (guanine527-N7)-methyltransferase